MFTKYFGTVKVHKNRFVELLDPKFIIDLKHVVCILHQDSSLEVKFCYTSTTKAATIAFLLNDQRENSIIGFLKFMQKENSNG